MAMLDRVVDNVLSAVGNYPKEYEQNVYTEVSMLIEDTNIPVRFQKDYIDPTVLPKASRTAKLFKEFSDLIYADTGGLVRVNSYKETGYIISGLMENTIQNCLIKDTHVPTMLYIDTNLLLEDYSSVMDSSKGTGVLYKSLIPQEVITSYIYTADFVFWDKFDLCNLAYANRKLYEILTIRYNRCLNNLFFIKLNQQAILEKLGTDLYEVMNVKKLYSICDDNANTFKLKGDSDV